MKQKKYQSIPVNPNEVTPKDFYMNRRKFLKGMGLAGIGALLASCAPAMSPDAEIPEGAPTEDLREALTDYEAITNYINYYEFTTRKDGVAELAKNFTTDPWAVEVSGLVENPQVFSMEDILTNFTQEERIYRMRCVEGWSMVIPWLGFPLHKLLDEVKLTAEARYVLFETALVPEEMPNAETGMFPFPYLEGLRLDEAMHDLTLLATGLYNEPLTPQNGAPIRLVVPWKYGFKSSKSLVRIALVADEPPTLWSTVAPQEYGFYANVNPAVDHPRWSQATERRIGETGRIPTLFMNGYAEEVMPLYEGMDLRINY